MVLLTTLGKLSAQQPSSQTGHVVQVSDVAVARELEAAGGKLIADYGSYRLYEVKEVSEQLRRHSRVEIKDQYQTIFLNAGKLNTHTPKVQAMRKALRKFNGKRLHLVQFAGPILPEWRQQLIEAGVAIVSYLPENCYLVYGDQGSLARMQGLAQVRPYVQWEGVFQNEYKIHPSARTKNEDGTTREIGTDLFAVQLMNDSEANSETLALLNRLKLEPFKRQESVLHYLNVIVRLEPSAVNLIAEQPDVISIMPYFRREKLCERQDQIIAGNLTGDQPSGPGYLAWLTNSGFTQQQFDASGIVVEVVDSGVDNGTTLPGHFGLYSGGSVTNASRVVFNRYEATQTYSTNSLEGCDGHGNINAHIIAGYDDYSGFPFTDDSGFHYGLGVCPFVQIGSSVIFDSVNNNSFYFPDYNNLESEAYNNGVRISNNSWGGRGSDGVYDFESQNYDALVRDAQPTNSTYPVDGSQPMVIVFAAGNEGSAAQTVDTPGTAKNVISVGAAANVQPFGNSDRSGIGDDQASSANDIAGFSSRGPCTDGRMKPDLVAPGTHVSGGVYQATNDFVNYPNGIAGDCYTGNEVSGGPDGPYWPDGQQFYTASSGTSHSTPAVSGACALVLQYFLNNFTNLPSPAMTKAYLLNTARYLTGNGANDTLPSPNQGMGELNLGMAFDGVARILRDQLDTDTFTNSGQIRAFTGYISDTNQPLRVTLAWTDAPGSLSGYAYNNNLDLSVIVGGNTYKGNVFSNAYSVPGGSADIANNVESVFLPAGTTGQVTILVNGTSINSIGIPNTNNALCQDFALVAYNAIAAPTPVVIMPEATLAAESCLPTNGVIDPGETVTVNFELENIGGLDVTNLMVTFQTNSTFCCSNNINAYGLLAANSLAISIPFTFTVNAGCGSFQTATLLVQDGTNALGTLTYNFNLGTFVSAVTWSENFDELTVPNLPTNWISSMSGAAIGWYSTNNIFDSATNSLFTPDVASIGISELTSQPISIFSSRAQLTFRNYYDLESDPPSSASPDYAFDGGVLEIQIGTNAFVDIQQAGGVFVTGGYDAVIEPHDDNPFGIRPVWSGNSGGFITSTVTLPATAAGQTVQFKWRCGTDSGNYNGGSGWYIDSVQLQDGYYQCCLPLTAPLLFNCQSTAAGFVYSFQSVNAQTYTAQSCTDLTLTNWTNDQFLVGDGTILTVTNSPLSDARFYRLRSP